jgi:hypothetical protein
MTFVKVTTSGGDNSRHGRRRGLDFMRCHFLVLAIQNNADTEC